MRDEKKSKTESLPADYISDLRLAASKLTGHKRRSFQAEMALKYCDGNPRKAERMFGWGRANVQLGLHENRTGIICLGSQPGFGGRKRWEEQHPDIAEELRQIAESHSQQDPTFQTTLAYSRLTAKAALEALKERGYDDEDLPSAGAMANILNRMGFRLRKVQKAKPKKKSQKQTQSSRTSRQKMKRQSKKESQDG